MIVRIGLPKSTGALPAEVERIGAPALISANSLWDARRGHFRAPGSAIGDLDCALDSAGFVAMQNFGGYPWSVAAYCELAAAHSWSWWASMDFCCEPQIAGNRGEVEARVFRTAYYLGWCRKQIAAWRLDAPWCYRLTDPMPILQGWRPDDYEWSAALTDNVLDGAWPAIVGIGSVCRRPLTGPDGIRALLRRLDAVLPPGVGLHLFGVKGGALAELAEHPRVVSTDSQAWGTRARVIAREADVSCDLALKRTELRRWYERQAGAICAE